MSSFQRKLLIFLLIGAGAWWFFVRDPANIVNAQSASGPIVAFGDSLTAGFGAPKGEAYPDVLAELIGQPVFNAGMNGDSIADAAARLDEDVLGQKPGVVIVLLGGNDVMQRNDLDQSFNQLRAIIERIQSRGAVVVLVGMGDVAFTTSGLSKRYKLLAKETGCVFIPDILDGILFDPKLKSDQVHPNAAGYKLMAERVAKAIKPYLK